MAIKIKNQLKDIENLPFDADQLSTSKKFDDTNQLIRELDLTKMKNKSILIKGSRSIGLEKLIN